MSTVAVDYSKIRGKVKPMHAVNNGPVKARGDQVRGNFDTYKAAKIPFARNHDAAFFSDYGGEHSVDVNAIFPNFDADPYDPKSYDFTCTDHYTKTILDAGTKVFYRLGSKIEHTVKKYNTLPPKDFKKWAVICEHIIRHYNEGWADGFHWNILYWEIWNEPDLDPDDSLNKRCWGGTAKEFYELYVITAKHLKSCFPNLKIGGPAVASFKEEWFNGFMEKMTEDGEHVPLDFFSWHWYGTNIYKMLDRAHKVRKGLEKYGYLGVESILNEWNYVANWTDKWISSIQTMISLKGAAFIAACMCASENDPDVDMLMYYDARPGAMNGLFDYYTYYPIKGYYTYKMFSELYELGSHAETVSDDKDIFAASAIGGDKKATMISFYTDEENIPSKEITVKANGCSLNDVEVYLLDSNKDCEKIEFTMSNDGSVMFMMEPNTVVLVKSK